MTTKQLNLIMFFCLAAFVCVGPLFFYPVVLMKAMSYAIFAMAFNLVAGYGGMLSFGHAAFFGTAAYVTAFSLKLLGFPPEVAILLSMLTGCVIGWIIGRLSIPLRGIHFAMVTLALSQIIYFIAYEAPITNGDDGVQGVPRGNLFGIFDLGDPIAMYIFVAVVFVAVTFLIFRIIYSPFGKVVEIIRQNEPRAISLGYDSNNFKLAMFVISATLSGLAGSINCLVLNFATVNNVHWRTSGDVILMSLIGGIGTPFGPAIGAFALVFLDQGIASLGSLVNVVRGLIFIVCVLAFRQGIMGAVYQMVFKHIRRRKYRSDLRAWLPVSSE